MATSLTVGVDIGTGGCETCILSEEGKVVSESFQDFSTHRPKPSWAEQNPNEWYNKFVICLKEAMRKGNISPEDITSISIDGMPHTPVLLDDEHNIIRPTILYTDHRSSKQSEQLKKNWGEQIFEIGLNQVSPSWTLSILSWIKENKPETWGKISNILLPKDYIRFKLVGTLATDITDAATTLLFNPKKRKWSEELCEIIDLPMDVLPEVVPPKEIVGEVTKEASRETGLPRGTLVVAGADDVCAENLGAGVLKEGQWTVKLATTGRITWATEEPLPHPDVVLYPHVIQGMWLSGVGSLASPADSLKWFVRTFGNEERRFAETFDTNVYKLMDIEAENAPPGSDGLIFHPYLGSYAADLRGSIMGIENHHRKSHFIRSLLEGVSFSLKDRFNSVEDKIPNMEKEAILLGGGSRSRLWSQILSDVLGTKLLRLKAAGASFGSAIIGGVGAGTFRGYSDGVKRCRRFSEKITPNQKNHSYYSKLFKVYQSISQILKKTSLF